MCIRDSSKVALIITEKYEAIATAIDSQLDRGVTLLKGQGYYKRQDKMVLLSAVKRKQLAELKELVMDIDPDAFIIRCVYETGLDGCEHAVFEILSNAIDEAREGYGKLIIVTRYADRSIEVEDFGRSRCV